ncbi:20664_t:CDS:1, partial [Funneliformis geosporum]
MGFQRDNRNYKSSFNDKQLYFFEAVSDEIDYVYHFIQYRLKTYNKK